VLADCARRGENFGAGARARDEHTLAREELELGDEIEVVRNEPRNPLLDVAFGGTVPRGRHARSIRHNGAIRKRDHAALPREPAHFVAPSRLDAD
jgi:hypothetical protein